MHGALGSSRQLDTLAKHLSEHYKVYSFDFEGHGGRPTEKPFSIDLFVQNTVDFMKENAISSAHFFGYSMGGYVALKLASKHPNLVDRVFTYATKFDWTPESADREIKMLDPDKILEKVPQFAAALEQMHAPLSWKENMTKTAAMMVDLGNGSGISDNELQCVQHKVMIGIGDKDQMVSIEESKRIADILTQGELNVFKDFQHPIEKINIVELSRDIKNFFRV